MKNCSVKKIGFSYVAVFVGIMSFGVMNIKADEVQNSANIESNNEDKKFFTFSGQLSNFMKAGFNNAKIDKNAGQYPTESFGQILGVFDTRYDVLKLIKLGSLTRFNVGLGASTSGLFFDSTLRDGAADAYPNSGLSGGSGRNLKHVGAAYPNYIFKTSNYFIVQNAFVDIETILGDKLVAGHDLFLAFKGGRYESSMDYYSAYTEGFNVDMHFGYGDTHKNPDNSIKVWWFNSFARAFAYPRWFFDYAPVFSADSVNTPEGYGVHAVGVDINYGGIVKSSSGYDAGWRILVSPFMYFYPGMFGAYGLKGVYENSLGNGYSLKATLQGYYLNVNANYTTATNSANKSNNEIIEANSGNIMAIVQGNMFDYNVKVGLYKNFKAAASKIATYGSPIGFDYWAGSVYDVGTGMSDVLSRNAITGFISGGATHNLKYGSFTWDVLARITGSDRSDEQSVALQVKHSFKNNLALGFRVEWLRDTTKKGYNPGDNIYPTALSADRTDDRSYAFVMVDYLF